MYKKLSILYFAQIYKAILPLIFIPIILKALGAERYGMISFFSMLVGWLGILDIGVSGSFLKLVATSKNNAHAFEKTCNLFFKISLCFLAISIVLSASVFLSANYLATQWLQTKIEANESITCIKIIGFVLALNYIKIYLSSFLTGMEKQHFLAGWGAIASSLLYAGSYGAIFIGPVPLLSYFYSVLFFSFVDLSVIALMLFFVIKKNNQQLQMRPDPSSDSAKEEISIRNILHFSLQLSGLSAIWVIATQIDKLILSKYVALADYAHYQIAAQLSMLISVFIAPLSQYLMPRLSALWNEKKPQELIQQLMYFLLFFIIAIGPIPIYFFLLGDNLVFAWMHNRQLGHDINNYAKWLTAASYISALMNFMFILRYALGKLKKYFYSYALYSAITIPTSIAIAKYWGAGASAKFIFLHSFIFMLICGAGSIRKMVRGLLPLITSTMLLVSLASLSTFYVFSKISADSLYSNLLLKVIIPPLINYFLIVATLWALKKRLQQKLNRCEIMGF